MTLTANIGEWSELYALGTIVSQGGLYASDEDENIRKNLFYKALEAHILSTDTASTRQYVIKGSDILIYNSNKKLLDTVHSKQIASYAKELFDALLIPHNGRAFELIESENLLSSLKVEKIKASNNHKSDLSLILEDPMTSSPTPLQGFSIKSQIGAPSTLINASKATNFTYAVTGKGSPQNMNDKDVKGNTKSLYEQKFSLEFINIDSPIYMENMRLIDSQLPNYIAELLIEFNQQKGGLLTDIIDRAFTEDKEQKVLKIKEFLVASALGMMPNTKWDGQLTTMGGIILVKKTSDVLCFYLYNMEDFQNYLLKHVKFETPSTTRYGIGKIINEDSILKYKLNLQIRFTK